MGYRSDSIAVSRDMGPLRGPKVCSHFVREIAGFDAMFRLQNAAVCKTLQWRDSHRGFKTQLFAKPCNRAIHIVGCGSTSHCGLASRDLANSGIKILSMIPGALRLKLAACLTLESVCDGAGPI